MADYEDKIIGPVFPTRSGTAPGGSTERQMLDATQGASGIRTKLRSHPEDGSTTLLKTRGGHPHFYTEKKEDPSASMFLGGLSATVFIDGAQDGKPFIYKLSPAIVTPGKKAPGEVEAYALTIPGGGGYSYRKDGSVKSVWTSGNSKVSGDIHEWEMTSNKIIHSPVDDYYIPFAFGKIKFIASDTSILKKNGDVLFSYTRPSIEFFSNVGPKQYDKLYPLVTYDQSKAVLQSSDSQMFRDMEYGVPTEMRRLYDGVVFDAETMTTASFSGQLFTGYPTPPVVTNNSNSDGASLSRSYPCVAYRPWADIYNPDGTGKPAEYKLITEYGANDLIPPARADNIVSEVYSASETMPFTKTVIGDRVVDVGYGFNLGSNKSTNIIRRYFENGMTDPWAGVPDRWTPYFVRVGQSMEDCSIHNSESVDIGTSIKIGDKEYPVFSAKGKSKCDAGKFNHVAKEGCHPQYGTNYNLDGSDVSLGKFFEVLCAACGYSTSTMSTWSGTGLGGGFTADITKNSYETDRLEHLELEATGCYHLAADATLDFCARLEFSFKYVVDLNSATFDTAWKWKIPRYIPPVDIFAEAKLVVEHKGAKHEKSLFIGSMTKRPPMITSPVENPYYFVWLTYGGAAIRALLALNEADIIWLHKLPDMTPQPSWFNSLDTIVRQQQTSPYLAGFSASEIAQAQENNSRFPTPGVDLIFSRRINMREAGADWLFKAYGIDEPTTTGGRAYGYSDDLYSLICEKTWRFEYDSANGLNFWTDTVSESVGDSESDKYANCFRV